MKKNADYWIKHLNLNPHPEGGYYNEKYRDDILYNGNNLYTSIYFLLKSGETSKFHKLSSDEIWYYHYGSSVKIYMIDSYGKLDSIILGNKIHENEKLQYCIPGGTIFGAEIIDDNSYGLVACLVCPGFSFDDFKLFSIEEITGIYPEYNKIIGKLYK